MATPLPSPPRRRTATSTPPERRALRRSGVPPLPDSRTGPDRGAPVAPSTPPSPADPATPATPPTPADPATPPSPATAATPAGPVTDRRPGAGGERLTPFDPTILAVRWSTTVVCVALAAGAFLSPDPTVIPWVLAVVANTAVRTRTPVRDDGSVHSTVNLLLEVALHVLAVVATGHWTSPLVLLLVNAIIVAGFARGFAFALRIGAISAVAVSLPGVLGRWTMADATFAAQWTTVLLAVAIVAGYARRLWGEASHQHRVDQQRLDHLADANTLLASLHRVAQALPSSLDVDEVLDSTVTRLRSLIDHHGGAVLLLDDTDDSWAVARQYRLGLARRLQWDDLPPPAAEAARTRTAVLVPELAPDRSGFRAEHGAGLYAPLVSRDRLVGLLCLEHRDRRGLGEREHGIVTTFSAPVSLALDNARLFARLRTVGADEERTRIARDLHDRIGQSLAYLAFEVDRLVDRDRTGQPLTEDLTALRRDLRAVVVEVRDTLYDLRTDVTESKDLPAVVQGYVDRVAQRSGLAVTVDGSGQRRLPLRQERELWRIAQEAIANVERHAAARHVTVVWRCDRQAALLQVSDDGIGFPDGAGRFDSYGIVGMRERAASIGAALDIDSGPGEGTTVRCYLEHR